MELWKDIDGAEKFYEVSSHGRIRNKISGNILKPSTSGGYAHVELRYGINKNYSVHRLVACAFVPNPYNFNIVNHKDENKLNNHADNLEWCTQKYNIRYGDGFLARNSRVIQYDMNGNALQIWESIKDASETLGVLYQGISMCCRNEHRTCGGYMWSYATLNDVNRHSKVIKE